MLSGSTAWLAQPDEVCWYDRQLVWLIFALLLVGLVAVTTASEPVATRLTGQPLYFAIRHGIFLVGSLIIGSVVVQIPLSRWMQISGPFLLVSLILLVAVLFVGHTVNGAQRWIPLGVFNLQPAELAKLSLLVFLSGYLVRRQEDVRSNFYSGFFKPMSVLAMMGALLLLQPDFGSFVVMLIITIGMLFLAGAKLWQFIVLVMAAGVAVAGMIMAAPYRLKRLASFMDPWADPFGSGYQLTQSLMAFGRGDWFGQGLGNSIQKLEYLPEAHTDFVFSVIAEELGLFGVTLVLLLLFGLVFKALAIGRRCVESQQLFGGYIAYGLSFWFAFQTLVNAGAASGLLPTKGLTLPLISYGGASLFIMATAVALLIRVDHEQRIAAVSMLHQEHSENDNESE
nr:cell division protein FtsW [Thaumasiovibrio subtropicus]